MREIVKDLCWVGNARDARDLKLLGEMGIDAVLDLAIDEPPAQSARERMMLRVPLIDGTGNDPVRLRLAIKMLGDLLRQRVRTLVACSGGMSRSPLIVAAVLSRLQASPVAEVLARMREHGPVDVHPGLLRDVQQILAE